MGDSTTNTDTDASAGLLDVAIIGAGLAGALLALSLKQQNPSTKITIFESRPPTAPEHASGIILTPNGLQVLQKLQIYPRIKDICWTNSYRTYVNDKDETTRRVLTASEELYGFKNHRLYRRVLLRTIKEMCVEHKIPIHYNARFEGITSDTPASVTFQINNEPVQTALLIGADGIYSSVRRHIAPTITAEYTGTVGLLAHINWSSVSWPSEDFPRQSTIQGKPGAFFMIPETRDGEDVMVGMQIRHPPLSRTEWESLANDKAAMSAFFRRDYDAWHSTGQKVIDAVTDPDRGRESLFFWPFLRMPKLEQWYSPTGRVILVGDAAHAIPPSSGQGTNQALEDVDSLTMLLTQTKKNWIESLAFWQQLRQKRVDAVFEWATNATNVSRMSEEERRRLIREGKVPDPDVQGSGATEFFDDMKWLYVNRAEEEIREWVEGGGKGGG